MNRLTQKSQEALQDAQTEGAALRAHRGRRRAPPPRPPRSARRAGPSTSRPGRRRPEPTAHRGRSRSSAADPELSGPGAAPGQVFVTQRLARLLDAAEERSQAAQGRVRVGRAPGHRLPRRGHRHRGRTPAARPGPDPGPLPGGAHRGAGQPAGHLGHARGRLRGAREVRAGPGGRRPDWQARPRHRPRQRDPPGRADPVPQDQEQPGADRRSGSRQDGHRGGPGPAHRARRRAGGSPRQDHLRPRHGLAGGGSEVPRRVRGAAQGRAHRGARPPRVGSCCSSTSCTPWSAPGPPKGPWTPATCSSRCWPGASST